ncbi:FecR family protein [Mangrovibacterium diazotrophicum]|uniref:FecR family protein n=1 Tax=Mangrovibacterium diazotrophicum TaxID=1261403 RepID=A0A419W5V7_9BACT|nr:FecR domain-containing protein [Mangrovibacterium diazotrophicum]RKD90832.1 FecR family protein [Mangrovibacterium diazotrophicum]
MKTKREIQQLAYKWKNNTISPHEREELEDWYNQNPQKAIEWTKDLDSDALRERLLGNIISTNRKNDVTKKAKKSLIGVYKYASAAAVLIIALGLWFLLDNRKSIPDSQVVTEAVIDIPPGRQAATLILGNGMKVELDTMSSGGVLAQSNVLISKAGTTINYQVTDAMPPEKGLVDFNTIYTNRGNQFQLTLVDGTKVWLNSESSITYPARFDGVIRKVELTGEAFFEVAKNPNQPFVVTARGVDVKVLGTHFNISAYNDDQFIKTTLVEGSVQVYNQAHSVRIIPGEQASIGNLQSEIKVSQVDVNQVLAWQQGFFEFTNATLPEIVKQISRWYDVDIRVEEGVLDKRFGGRISNRLSLTRLLDLLGGSGIYYEKNDSVLVIKRVRKETL